jgi:hypothetical protein
MTSKESLADRVSPQGPSTVRRSKMRGTGLARVARVALAAGALEACVNDGDLFVDHEWAGSPRTETGAPAVPLEPGEPVAPGSMRPQAPPPVVSLEPTAPGEPGSPSVPDGSDPVPAPPAPEPPTPESEATSGARGCPPPTRAELLDFEGANEGASQASFGDFASVLSGGTFVYPEALVPIGANSDFAAGLRSDVSEGDWHVTGLVAGPAALGLFFDCQQLDASGFTGISFRLAGELPAPTTLLLMVGSAGNDVSRSWLLEAGQTPVPSVGRCTPREAQFDGTCQATRVAVPVRPQGAEVVVRFADLADGSPEFGLNPAEITSIQWALPGPSADASGAVAPYEVDLRLDDIRFIAE